MRKGPSTLSVLTYNVHRGVHPITKRSVQEDVRILLEYSKADVICLQEVFRRDEINQSDLEKLCEDTWGYQCFGQNAVFPHGSQGNAILSRFAIKKWINRDITIHGKEPRGVLVAEIVDQTHSLDCVIVCTHFGLHKREKVSQANMLKEVLSHELMKDKPVVLAGDFNDWHGVFDRDISAFGYKEAHRTLKSGLPRTFPSFFPVLSLDRLYYRGATPIAAAVVRQRRFHLHSDHLPVVSVFQLPESASI